MKVLRETQPSNVDQLTKYHYKGVQAEMNTQPGKTVPDQSLSVRQIMMRHTAGVPLNVKTPNFNNDEEIENEEYTGRDPRTMDISEIHEELETIAERQKLRIKTQEELKQKQKEEDARKLEEQKKQDYIREYLEKQKPQE